MTTPEIKAAEDKLKAKQLLAAQAEEVMNAARTEVGKAAVELATAHREHDLTLPGATVRTTQFYSGKHDDERVAIVRKTEKSVFVRLIGEKNEKGDQFRLNKSGNWVEYPAPPSFANEYRELILDGDKK